MFYDEAIDYIRRIEADGSDYGLERERELLDALGAPDRGMRIVHVAGTNGKGSVCAMLTSVLRAAGYRTGTYNSPSVLRYNERFCIDGVPLPDGKVARYMTVVRDTVERERRARGEGADEPDGVRRAMKEFRPTAFEQETALALYAFRQEGCDVCVLETGLGGRWDATNAVENKMLSVITKIGLDHCALLGGTLREIAAEKAAIIKGAAVTCPQEKGAAEVLYPLCRVCGEPRYLAGGLDGQRFAYGGGEYGIRLLGRHQLTNAALVIEAVRELNGQGMDISESALKKGLSDAVWHARFEVLTEDNAAKSPYNVYIPHGKVLVLDGAHNPQGAAALADAMKEYLSGKRVAAVTGVLADKDYAAVMRNVVPLVGGVYAVTPDSPRALSAERLKECIEEFSDVPVSVCADVREGVERALRSDAEAAVVFGSLTLFRELARR